MKTKLLILPYLIIIMSACSGNKDYAYNEFLANRYLDISRQFEENYEKLKSGELRKNMPQILKDNTTRTIEELKGLEPSDAAKELHNKTNEFLYLIEKDFYPLLKTYVNLDCDCPEKKDSIIVIAGKLYDKASVIETEMLSEQLKFMEKVGLKPTNSKN